MKLFKEWIKDRINKMIAVRRWLWNQTYEHGSSPSPVNSGDPDYEWVMKTAKKLGPLDPQKHESFSDGIDVSLLPEKYDQ